MRLIDADELMEEWDSLSERGRTEFDQVIMNHPTAYDVEKVVEQMEEYRAKFDCRTCKHNKTEGQVCTKDCTDALIDGLLEIVRKGEVE